MDKSISVTLVETFKKNMGWLGGKASSILLDVAMPCRMLSGSGLWLLVLVQEGEPRIKKSGFYAPPQ